MKTRTIVRNSIITTFTVVFIVLYFLYLIESYIIPNKFEISVVLFLGFAIIITGIFYFFSKIDSPNKIIAQVNILDENAIKIILMILMVITIFIPAVSFSDVIIAWNEILPLNYVRGVVFLLGALIIPGACIFNLILPKNAIHERLNVEPFLIKLTIYPILSLTYLGSVTLALDFFGFTRSYIFLFLFLSFIFLFALDIFFQKIRGTKPKIKTTEIRISRYTFLILFIGLGIIIIAFGTILSSHQYILGGDRWRGISPASLIGSGNFATTHTGYIKYWGSVSFGLSVLCGIPYINTNVLLFPFLYLSITSVYLFTKALLSHIEEKFCVLASIFIAIVFDPIKLNFQFSFHSFAFFSLFISLALFFIVVKSDHMENREKLITKDKVLLVLSALFFVQSIITYYLPFLIGIITIFLYSLFSNNFKQYLKRFLVFYGFFIIFFLIIDLMVLNYFSFWSFQFLSVFSEIPFNFVHIRPYSLRIALTAFLFYTIFLSSLLILFFIYKFSSRLSSIIKKVKLKINTILEKKHKFLFIFLAIFILICFFLANLDPTFGKRLIYGGRENQQEPFLIFYLSTLLGAIGFLGILGISLSYFSFKENKNLFVFLLSWTVVIIGLASSLIFIRWIQNPTSLVSDIPEDHKSLISYFFSRTWYYSMIPLSIFASIGLIRLIQKLKSHRWFIRKTRGWFKIKTYKEIISYTSLALIPILIFLFLSSPIARIIYWDNYYAVSDEEAQIIGWVSKNIPKDSRIMGPWMFRQRLEDDLYLYKIYDYNSEMNSALNNYTLQEEDLYKWIANKSSFGEIKLLYEEDEFNNVILMHDKSDSGKLFMVKNFIEPQTNGTISFYLKIDTADENLDAGLFFKIYGENSSEGIDFYINYGNHYYYNDSNNNYDDIYKEYSVNEWNYYEFNFELEQNFGYWNVSINGIQINDSLGNSQFNFRGNPVNFSRAEFSTTIESKDYFVYFADFNYSWESINLKNDIYERILLNDITKLIYHLRSQKIHYFIISKHRMYLYQELINYFYRIQLYDYGNYKIYKSIEI